MTLALPRLGHASPSIAVADPSSFPAALSSAGLLPSVECYVHSEYISVFENTRIGTLINTPEIKALTDKTPRSGGKDGFPTLLGGGTKLVMWRIHLEGSS